jgi:aminoglycoside phosphotransferase (APT) family kinase protein
VATDSCPTPPACDPRPLAKGMPGEGYPWHWSVNPWFEGNDATVAPIADLRRAASELAEFIADLQRIDPSGGPSPGTHNVFRGVPLAARNAQTRKAIDNLVGVIDTDAAIAVGETALHAPVGRGRSGSMETSTLGTCWFNGAVSVPSSTGVVSAWAIPPMT